MPPPFFSTYLPMGPSGSVDSSSSIFDWPILKNAVQTFYSVIYDRDVGEGQHLAELLVEIRGPGVQVRLEAGDQAPVQSHFLVSHLGGMPRNEIRWAGAGFVVGGGCDQLRRVPTRAGGDRGSRRAHPGRWRARPLSG